MPKLTNYTFVEIFDEEKGAGKATLTEPVGMFEVGQQIPVFSKVTGLYCAELLVLLVDCRVGRNNNSGDFVDLKMGIMPTVQAHRNMTVTAAVRDLPAYADDWHRHVMEGVNAHDDVAKYTANFVAAVEAIRPRDGEGIDTVEISSHGTGDDKKVVLKAKGATK